MLSTLYRRSIRNFKPLWEKAGSVWKRKTRNCDNRDFCVEIRSNNQGMSAVFCPLSWTYVPVYRAFSDSLNGCVLPHASSRPLWTIGGKMVEITGKRRQMISMLERGGKALELFLPSVDLLSIPRVFHTLLVDSRVIAQLTNHWSSSLTNGGRQTRYVGHI